MGILVHSLHQNEVNFLPRPERASPSFPACSAAPPCRILVRTLSPSAGTCPAAALPMPPGLLPMPTGAALEPMPVSGGVAVLLG